jgi:hypothetical protein
MRAFRLRRYWHALNNAHSAAFPVVWPGCVYAWLCTWAAVEGLARGRACWAVSQIGESAHPGSPGVRKGSACGPARTESRRRLEAKTRQSAFLNRTWRHDQEAALSAQRLLELCPTSVSLQEHFGHALVEACWLAADRLTDEGDGCEDFSSRNVVACAPAVYRSVQERLERRLEPIQEMLRQVTVGRVTGM